MANKDVRWIQRLNNYYKALAQLEKAVMLSRERELSLLEAQGLIQAFEFTHELAWNVMKDYFEGQGNTFITGSKDATREAFNKGLITEGAGWMEMIKSRNQSTHTYNEETAVDIQNKILQHYYNLFLEFKNKMSTLQKNKP